MKNKELKNPFLNVNRLNNNINYPSILNRNAQLPVISESNPLLFEEELPSTTQFIPIDVNPFEDESEDSEDEIKDSEDEIKDNEIKDNEDEIDPDDELFNDIVDFYNDTDTNKEIPIIHFTDTDEFFTINSNLLNNIRDYINDDIDVIYDMTKSGGDVISLIISDRSNFELITKTRSKKRDVGSFFKYYINDNYNKLNLMKYGIFNKGGDKKEMNINCFIKALIESQVITDTELSDIKTMIVNRNIPMISIKKIALKYNLNIEISKFQSDNIRIRKTKYKPKNIDDNTRKIEIGLIDEHYFINDVTDYTMYSIKNYDRIKDVRDWNYIIKKTNARDKQRCAKSINIIKYLMQNKDKYLEKILLDRNILNTIYSDKIDNNIKSLEYNIKSYRKVEFKQKLDWEKYNNKIFFDTETINHESSEIFLISAIYVDYKTNETKTKSFIGDNEKDIAIKFLKSITTNCTLYAHNLLFDFRSIFKYLYSLSVLKSNGLLKTANGVFYNREHNKSYKLKFLDTYGLIPMPLKSFGKSFKIKVEKEIMPYNLYTKENIKKDSVPVDLALKHLNKDDHEQFISNLERLKIIYTKDNKKYFYHIAYSIYYCEQDCKVLQLGYLKFKEMVKEVTNLNLDCYISISQLASDYLKKQGCYDGCYEFSGIVREFIQSTVIGGKVMTRNNEKFIVTKPTIPIDVNSLYPAAMTQRGFLKGLPKVFDNTMDFDILNQYNGYFVEIMITDIKNRFPFPLINYKDNKGIRRYDDNIENIIGRKFIVNDITLNEWIKHHDISFNIIKGYYFNEGTNNLINEKMKYLYNKRLQYKKEKNPVQIVFKLIMNSSYGRTIMKPINVNHKIFDNEEKVMDYVKFNFSKIIKFEKIKNTEKYIVKESKPISSHFSCPHIGSRILSTSKQIMNNVLCLAHKMDISAYYMDTDSIHMKIEDLETLKLKYKEKYNKNLIGNNLGEFSNDIDIESTVEDPIIVKSIGLGKKCYYDKVKCINLDKNNNKIISYHDVIKMKGIPKGAIKHKCKQDNITVEELYLKLYRGEKIKFDLLYDDNVAKFKKNSDLSMNKLMRDKVKVFRSVQFK